MCGRFVSASPPEEIAEYFGATDVGDFPEPNFNVAPTSDVLVVYSDGSARRLDSFHWGLVPSWAKDVGVGNRMINARAETLAEKGAFRRSFERRRCIVPADGFYEWKAVAGSRRKQPYYVHRVDDEPLAFAGLWAEWRGAVAGEPVTVRSTTIITTSANETMAAIHDRMPVMLPPTTWETWLDPMNREIDRLQPLLVPAPPLLITMHPVSTDVGNARNQGAHLIERIPESQVLTDQQDPVQTTLL